MKWFYRWLRNKLSNADLEIYSNRKDMLSVAAPSPVRHIDTYGMNFSVHRANGGFIVQYSQYDKKTDRSDNRLHIVTDDKDLGEELGKIISFESLRT